MPDHTTEQELRRQADEHHKKAQDLVQEADEGEREWNSETEEQFEALMAERAELEDRANSIASAREQLEAEGNREERERQRREEMIGRLATEGMDTDEAESAVDELEQRREERTAAFRHYLLNGISDLDQRSVALLRDAPVYEKAEHRESDVVVGTSATGGVLAPTEFEGRFWEEMKDFGDMRQTNAFIFNTPHGRDVEMPTDTDTSNSGSRVSEASTIGSVTDVDLDLKTVRAIKYQSGPFALTREFLADAAIEPEGFIRRKIQTRIGRALEADFIASTGGSDRPEGIVTASSGAVTMNNGSSNLTFKLLYDLKHEVNRAYRARGAEWLFTDNTFKEVSKLTDSQGNFLLQPRLTENAPQMLLGAPVRINNSSTVIELDEVASATTAKKVIFYGDFRHYLIRDVMGVTVRRLDERFALTDKVGFVGFLRADGRVMQDPSITAAQKPIRCLLETT